MLWFVHAFALLSQAMEGPGKAFAQHHAVSALTKAVGPTLTTESRAARKRVLSKAESQPTKKQRREVIVKATTVVNEHDGTKDECVSAN